MGENISLKKKVFIVPEDPVLDRVQALLCRAGPALLALLVWGMTGQVHAGVEMELSVNRDRLYMGESVILQVKVTGDAGRAAPDVSQIADADVRLLGSREISNYTITIVQNRLVREGFSGRVFSFEVTPRRAGDFRIGPVTLDLGRRQLEEAGPVVAVTDVTDQDDVKIFLESTRDTVLVGEPFELSLRVLIRSLPGAYAAADPLFRDDPPVLNAAFLDGLPDGLRAEEDVRQLLQSYLVRRSDQPGLAVNEYTLSDDPFGFRGFFGSFGARRRARFALPRRRIDLDGSAYMEYRLDLACVADTENDYVFGPVLFKGRVPVNVDEHGRAEGRDVFAVGRACTVRVVPPPEEGRPFSFTGAIGTDMRLTAALDTAECNLGDPVQLTLTIAGDLTFERMLPPRLALQTNLLENFTVYDRTVRILSDVAGQRSYVYSIRPRHSGDLELPPLEVAYFDTACRDYQQRHSQPLPLRVNPGAAFAPDQMIGAPPETADDASVAPPAELMPAPPWTTAAGAHSVGLTGGRGVWILIMAGPLFFMMTHGGVRWRQWRAQRRTSRRRRTALHAAKRQLRDLARRPDEDTPSSAELCRILREFMAARYNCPAAAMIPEDLKRVLDRLQIPEGLAQPLLLCYTRNFEAAFARMPAGHLRHDARQLEHLLTRLARSAPSAVLRGPGRLALLAVSVLLAAPGASPAHARDAGHVFVWEQANAVAASAADPADWRRVALIYQQLIDDGVRNGALFYNQGTAWLQAGEYAAAARILTRAERYLGGHHDIEHNLTIAMARQAGRDDFEWPWQRIVFIWHYKLSMSHRWLIAAAAFCGAWIAWTLTSIGLVRTGRTLTWALIAVWAVFSSSYLTSLWQEHRAARFPAAAVLEDGAVLPGQHDGFQHMHDHPSDMLQAVGA